MSGMCECHNHYEMMGQPLCCSFCCLFVHTYMCVSTVIHHTVFEASVASELAYLPCLCVGIVSGWSGCCIPDMWYNSVLCDSLLPASVV